MSMRNRFTTADAARDYIQAGKATITIVSNATDTRFTYKVTMAKDAGVYFVSLLTGSDNESSYSYIGIIRNGEFRWTAKSRVTQEAKSFKAFAWLFRTVIIGNTLPATCEIWHEGRCGRCHKTLTVPSSLERGIGPECAKKFGASAHFTCVAATAG